MESLLVLVRVLCAFSEGFWLVRLLDLLFDISDSKSEERRFTTRHWWWLLAMVYCLLIVILEHYEHISEYALIIAALAVAIPVCYICKSDFISVISVVGCYESVLFMAKLVIVSLFGLFGGVEVVILVNNSLLTSSIALLIFSGIVWFASAFIITNSLKQKEIKYGNQHIKNTNIIGFIGLTFLLIYLFVCMRMHMDMFMFVTVTALAICIVIIHICTKYKTMEEQLKIIESWNDHLVNNYDNINKIYASQAKFYHDIHKHLRMIRHLLKNNDLEGTLKYIDSLELSTEEYKKDTFTGIDIIDIILSEKKKMVMDSGKIMTINASFLPNKPGIDLKDMCAIFSNLLDNALESAYKEIEVAIVPIHRMILFKIENDFLVEPKKKNGIFITSKKDKIFHGWGIKCVKSIVDKYEGHMECRVINKKFCVEIILNEL